MVRVYALKLEDEKYYVGKTENLNFRIDQHFNSGGSAWTKKYPPICVLEIVDNCDDYDEDKYTRIYMDKYGIENVRGGSFCEVVLEETTIKLLEKMRNGTQNKCFTCGKLGHFVNECDVGNIPKDADKCWAQLITGLREFSEAVLDDSEGDKIRNVCTTIGDDQVKLMDLKNKDEELYTKVVKLRDMVDLCARYDEIVMEKSIQNTIDKHNKQMRKFSRRFK